MVTINNEPIVKAVEQSEHSRLKIAILADSNLPSLDKTLRGDIDVTLTSLDKLAGFLGFNVEVNFIPRSPKEKAKTKAVANGATA